METLGSLLLKAFGEGAVTKWTVLNEKQMGFSGAVVAEVEVVWSPKSEVASAAAPFRPTRLFVKRIVSSTPPPDAAPSVLAKHARDRRSYANECTFLRHHVPLLLARGIGVPRPLRVDVAAADPDAAGTFTTLSESMGPGHAQHAVIPPHRIRDVLSWLARFHALHTGACAARDLRRGEGPEADLWDYGGHLTMARRPAGEFERVDGSFRGFCAAFVGEKGGAIFARPDLPRVGARLRAAAPGIAAALAPSAENAWKTCLAHGDLKAANIFLATENEGVKVIDWQWTGPGLGATDVAYLVATSFPDAVLSSAEIEPLLRHYHAVLTGALPKRAVKYPWEEFWMDYRLSLLDFARWAWSVRLGGDTPAHFAQRREEMNLNLGAFRRSVPCIAFVAACVEEFLPVAERAAAGR